MEVVVARVWWYLSSLVTLLCIAGATFAIAKVLINACGENWKELDWHLRNKEKVLMIHGLVIVLIAPAVETILCGTLLVLIFKDISSASGQVFLVFGGWFTIVRFFLGKTLNNAFPVWRPKDYNGGFFARIAGIIFGFIFGIVVGVLTLAFQSLWVGFFVNAIWGALCLSYIPLVLLKNKIEDWIVEWWSQPEWNFRWSPRWKLRWSFRNPLVAYRASRGK